MLKRHAVKVLREAEHGVKETAKLSGVSLRSVQRIEDGPAVCRIDGHAEWGRRGVGRQ